MNWLKKQYPVLLCLLPLIVYILTAARTLTWGDGAEFYIAARILGIPHPSGYPLFMLIGRIFYLLGPSPFLLNLLPGLFTCLTVYFLYLILFKFTKDRFVSITLPLFFAFGQEIWLQSVAAEIYTLNLLFFVLSVYLLFNISAKKRYIPVFFFIAGLALTNHLTALLYIIPLCIFIFFDKKRSLYYLPLALIPLTLYLYFPIRSSANPILDLFDPENLGKLVNYISGKAFHYRTLFFSGSYIIEQLQQFLSAWWRQFLILIPLGVYGIFIIKDKRSRNLLVIALVLIFCYSLLYNIPDKNGYYLPVYAIWLVFIALGISKIVPNRFKAVLFIFPLINIVLNYRICDLSGETSLDDLSTSIYETLPDNSMIISDDYFLYCSILNIEIEKRRNIIPVSQFYLRMNWYVDHLKSNYPQLSVSDKINVLLMSCNKELAATHGENYGAVSKEYCDQIQREIVNGNINRMPIYYFVYDDASWPKSWFEYYLKDRGLVYRFHKEPALPDDYPLNFPHLEKYRVDKLINPDAIAVAKKFAAAYNRRAIYRFQMKKPDAAIADFNKALEIYPDYHQVLSNLGLAYLSIGDTLKTIQVWQRYLEISEPGSQYNQINAWYRHLMQLYQK